jgi:hypothetical protein
MFTKIAVVLQIIITIFDNNNLMQVNSSPISHDNNQNNNQNKNQNNNQNKSIIIEEAILANIYLDHPNKTHQNTNNHSECIKFLIENLNSNSNLANLLLSSIAKKSSLFNSSSTTTTRYFRRRNTTLHYMNNRQQNTYNFRDNNHENKNNNNNNSSGSSGTLKNALNIASINAHIIIFVLIFLLVLVVIVGRVIYTTNDVPFNQAQLKYHRDSVAAAALNNLHS